MSVFLLQPLLIRKIPHQLGHGFLDFDLLGRKTELHHPAVSFSPIHDRGAFSADQLGGGKGCDSFRRNRWTASR